MSILVRQRALQTWAHSLCIIAVFTFPYFFNIKTVHSLQEFDSKEKFVLCCYLVVFIIQHFCFANGYLFYLFLLLKITLFNTVHCDG